MTLLPWLLALIPLLDGHNFPIPLPRSTVEAIATAAEETEAPKAFAAILYVLVSHESAGRIGAIGDNGRSCGIGQTPCAITPKDALGQARLMIRILKHANDVCPGHPIYAYASGRCVRSWAAEKYEREVREVAGR